MSTPNLASPDVPPPGAAPPAAPHVPPGWLANWSPDHNSWYYVFTATGATQWEYPAPPPSQQPPPTEQPHYTPSPGGTDVPAQDGDRGLGKTALALGGGLLAASSFKPLGQKVGAKMAGFFGSKPQPQQNYQPSPAPQVHVYPVYMPGPQGASPPPYHGQSPPMDPNYGHYAAGNAAGVPPAMSPGAMSPGMAMNAGGPGGFPSQAGPPLYIYGAVFADSDVTQVVRSLVTPQQTLTLSGETLVKQLGDPWPEAERKQFSVLYAYGDRPMEIVAADTTTVIIEIKNEAISKKRMEYCQPPPSQIIACVWGIESALTLSRRQQLEKDGEMEGSEPDLGKGGFWAWEPRTLVCYFRTEAGGVGIKCCREGGTLRLPWNPLAKWS